MGNIAKYIKCALQVNSSSYSKFRGKTENKEEEFNNEMISYCLKNDIQVVGLAEHGSVDKSESLRVALENAGIVVFPGFEVSSAEKIHMVCLFPPEYSTSKLNRILGGLGMADAVIGTEASHLSCLEIAKSVKDHGGFWYAAHITGDNGILKTGSFPHIWKNPSLIAAQIPDSKENMDYKYLQITQNKVPEYKRTKAVALINAKDVVDPSDLDKPQCSVLVKMTSPTFENFRSAFKDPESRIRLNSERKEYYQSSIESITVTGGYLDGFHIDFSENLTTVIGGRGTGKSTLVGLIRYALQLEPISQEAKKDFTRLIDNNLGAGGRVDVRVYSNARHGERFTVTRRYKSDPVVKDSQNNVSSFSIRDILPMIEIYGQNEIIEISRDKAKIRDVADRLFTHSEEIDSEIRECHELLQKNGERLVDLESKISSTGEDLDELPQISEKLKYYQDAGLEQKLQVIRKLAEEEGHFTAISSAVKKVKSSTLPLVFKPEVEGECFSKVNQQIDFFNEQVKDLNRQYQSLFEELEKTVKQEKDSWESGKEKYDGELRESLKSIEGINDKSSDEIANEYSKLVCQESSCKHLKAELDQYQTEYDSLLIERRNLIENQRKAFDSRDKLLKSDLKKINKQKLNGTVRVGIEYRQNLKPLTDFIQSKVSGVAGKSLACLYDYSSFDVFEFANHCRCGKDRLKEEYGLKSNTAKLIAESLTKSDLLEIEEMILGDIVTIELNVNGTYKNLEDLSKGQQCTAILNLLLLDNEDPLIIDQPEDNLDNSFIAENLVDSLRNNKIKRQYILVSHNANIPVFGDAEQIIAMEEFDGTGRIAAGGCGSIDEESVKQHVINILEGGKDAFKMREEKYDLS